MASASASESQSESAALQNINVVDDWSYVPIEFTITNASGSAATVKLGDKSWDLPNKKTTDKLSLTGKYDVSAKGAVRFSVTFSEADGTVLIEKGSPEISLESFYVKIVMG
ncbi:hypothetical protein H0H92_002870 [Tricholoma furcatifolium]|nr:hypothetical protein H0H92_002870 [Tricholoma furcatifolium]